MVDRRGRTDRIGGINERQARSKDAAGPRISRLLGGVSPGSSVLGLVAGWDGGRRVGLVLFGWWLVAGKPILVALLASSLPTASSSPLALQPYY